MSDHVHFVYGMEYTLQQVYEIVERMIPADVYTSVYQEKLSRGRGTRWQPGQSSNSQPERSQGTVARREKTANVAGTMEKCPRCLGPHAA